MNPHDLPNPPQQSDYRNRHTAAIHKKNAGPRLPGRYVAHFVKYDLLTISVCRNLFWPEVKVQPHTSLGSISRFPFLNGGAQRDTRAIRRANSRCCSSGIIAAIGIESKAWFTRIPVLPHQANHPYKYPPNHLPALSRPITAQAPRYAYRPSYPHTHSACRFLPG